MAKAGRAESIHLHKSYSKRMSDHVAFALIVYTLMLIFLVAPAMETRGSSILPYFLLVLLVGVVIPSCRRFERRWSILENSELSQQGLNTRFTLDRIKLWIGAAGIPVVLATVFRSVSNMI